MPSIYKPWPFLRCHTRTDHLAPNTATTWLLRLNSVLISASLRQDDELCFPQVCVGRECGAPGAGSDRGLRGEISPHQR